MARVIEVVPHDPEWSDGFKQEVEALTEIFDHEIVAIHHIGSTAIPGILAKPIIDVLVEVRDIERIDAFNRQMRERGYLPKGEFGIAGRRFFIKGTEESRTHHIHIFQAGNPEFERHLAFRDYLRAHRDQAQAYSRLKAELARRFPRDADSYTAGKSDFVEEIERKAEAWERARRQTNSS